MKKICTTGQFASMHHISQKEAHLWAAKRGLYGGRRWGSVKIPKDKYHRFGIPEDIARLYPN